MARRAYPLFRHAGADGDLRRPRGRRGSANRRRPRPARVAARGGAGRTLASTRPGGGVSSVAEALHFEVGAEHVGERLDRFLSRSADERHLSLSRTRLKALIEAGDVAIDGAPARDPAAKVVAGARIEVAA